MFSCELSEIFKNTFLYNTLVTASETVRCIMKVIEGELTVENDRDVVISFSNCRVAKNKLD